MAAVDKQEKEAAAAKLRSEVQAFASQLGLAAAAGSHGGFDDSDFRPEAAKRKISDGGKQQKGAPAPKPPQQQKPQQPAAAQKRARGAQGVLGKQLAVQAKQQAEAAARQEERKGRDWNIGVGPRPGTLSASACRRAPRCLAAVACRSRRRSAFRVQLARCLTTTTAALPRRRAQGRLAARQG